MIPHILHYTARDKNLSWEERELQRQARKLLPDWEIRLWDDADNDALVQRTFPQYYGQFRAIRRGVLKADIARCLFLYTEGGVYADTDYKWVKRIPDELLRQKCVLGISRGTGREGDLFRVCNSVMMSEKNHPFWHDFIHNIFNSDLSSVPENMVEKITGPEGMSDFYEKNRSRYPDIYLAPRYVLHPPIRYLGFTYLGTKDTLGAHYCWGGWRTRNPLRNVQNFLVRKTTPLLGGFRGMSTPPPGRNEC